VPTDFSNSAYNAMFHAVKLVKDEACTFYILNVFNGFTPLRDKKSGKDIGLQREEESWNGLQNTYHRIKLDTGYRQHEFSTVSKRGNLGLEIVKMVNEKKIDLVVMGNRGRSEIDAIFMGSNALDIIDKLKKCPVLTVPKEIDFKLPKDIAFVTDYRHSYDAGLLQPLIFMAKQYNSRIRVMHIHEEEVLDKYQMMNQNILSDYLMPFEHTFHWMPLYRSKATAINVFLEELEIDLLIMLNYEHGFFERLTREPVIKRVAFNPDIPLLIIPYNN
jgi:nucleotide-binding universal stress UspA family protein